MECNHAHISNICDGTTCTCWCDTCQESFEAAWDKGVVKKGLCPSCGFPLEGDGVGPLTLEKVQETKLYHFFMPCDDCKPRCEALMKKEGLCVRCQNPMKEGEVCQKCTCKKKEAGAAEAACECYECKAGAKEA